MRAATRSGAVLVVFLLLTPLPAHAEWSAAAFLGASATSRTTLTLHRAGLPDVTWRDVPLAGRAFEPPPYYGYRLGWRPAHGPVGVEAELVHLKVYAPDGAMAPPVERYSLSHGLNLLLGNAVFRAALTRRLSIAARGGAGVAVPHAESRVSGVTQEQYEMSSAALQIAAGPRLTVDRHTHLFAEYKWTTTAPVVHVSGGTIGGRYTTQHVAAGLEVTW